LSRQFEKTRLFQSFRPGLGNHAVLGRVDARNADCADDFPGQILAEWPPGTQKKRQGIGWSVA
jgi:hypothetical protein